MLWYMYTPTNETLFDSWRYKCVTQNPSWGHGLYFYSFLLLWWPQPLQSDTHIPALRFPPRMYNWKNEGFVVIARSGRVLDNDPPPHSNRLLEMFYTGTKQRWQKGFRSSIWISFHPGRVFRAAISHNTLESRVVARPESIITHYRICNSTIHDK